MLLVLNQPDLSHWVGEKKRMNRIQGLFVTAQALPPPPPYTYVVCTVFFKENCPSPLNRYTSGFCESILQNQHGSSPILPHCPQQRPRPHMTMLAPFVTISERFPYLSRGFDLVSRKVLSVTSLLPKL